MQKNVGCNMKELQVAGHLPLIMWIVECFLVGGWGTFGACDAPDLRHLSKVIIPHIVQNSPFVFLCQVSSQ
jgi:hypothetical protein